MTERTPRIVRSKSQTTRAPKEVYRCKHCPFTTTQVMVAMAHALIHR